MHPAVPAAPLTEADILAALRDCYDPHVPCNIVDLGLVYSIVIAPDPDAPGVGIPGVPPRHRVSIELLPIRLADAEADAAPLIAQIQNRLAAFETISRTEISLLSHPAWTPDRISPEGYARLANRLTSKQPSNALVQIKVPAKT
jgi:metal-sulfur cluster biosynthetic enzyme